jgi:hypothetical protein
MVRTLLFLILWQLVFSPASAEPLRGGVEKTHTLQEWEANVLPTIKVGAVWSDSMLPTEHTDQEWFAVPPWKAGVLHGETAMEYEIKGGQLRFLGSHKNRFDLLAGQQEDAQGGYWHCARFPNVSEVEGDDRLVVVIGLASRHLQRYGNQETVKERSLEIARSKSSGKVISVRPVNSTSTWTPQADGTLLLMHDTLGPNGQSVKEGRVKVKRLAPFRTIDFLPDGFDLRTSFRNFLASHGMHDFLPSD